jgi:hypothetical protein
MDLTQYSRNRVLETFKRWDVPNEFAQPFYNYLVYGYNPGSCFTSILANDFARAIQRSHPANTIEAFKALIGWVGEYMPKEAYGSYDAVGYWCYLTSEARRTILEKDNLIFTSKEETWQALKGMPTHEPILY